MVFLGTNITFPCEGCKHRDECEGIDSFQMAHWRWRVECADFERYYDDDGKFHKPTDLHFFLKYRKQDQ